MKACASWPLVATKPVFCIAHRRHVRCGFHSRCVILERLTLVNVLYAVVFTRCASLTRWKRPAITLIRRFCCSEPEPRFAVRAFLLPGDVAAAEVTDSVAGVRACVAPSRGAELSSYQASSRCKGRELVPLAIALRLPMRRSRDPTASGWSCCIVVMTTPHPWVQTAGRVAVRAMLSGIVSCGAWA